MHRHGRRVVADQFCKHTEEATLLSTATLSIQTKRGDLLTEWPGGSYRRPTSGRSDPGTG